MPGDELNDTRLTIGPPNKPDRLTARGAQELPGTLSDMRRR
jgi:hypothetical protein